MVTDSSSSKISEAPFNVIRVTFTAVPATVTVSALVGGTCPNDRNSWYESVSRSPVTEAERSSGPRVSTSTSSRPPPVLPPDWVAAAYSGSTRTIFPS